MLAHCLLISARSMNGTMTAINWALEICLGARACSLTYHVGRPQSIEAAVLIRKL